MARKYLVFGSDDKVSWELLNTVEASGAEQALNKARQQEAHRHYGATPERNWSQGEPDVVEREPVVKWKMEKVGSDQMTVDDVIEEIEPIKEAPIRPAPVLETETAQEPPKERKGVL